MAKRGSLKFGAKHFTKVKKLARKGWRGEVKPGLKTAGKLAKKGVRTAGKAAYDHPGVVNKAINYGAGHVASYVGEGVTAATENPGMGAAAGVVTQRVLAKGGIAAKDRLLNHYFGTQHNKESTHSGRNYAIVRKPAVRYPHPSSSPADRSERLIKPAPQPAAHRLAAALRNTSHIRSASHPTGAKI